MNGSPWTAVTLLLLAAALPVAAEEMQSRQYDARDLLSDPRCPTAAPYIRKDFPDFVKDGTGTEAWKQPGASIELSDEGTLLVRNSAAVLARVEEMLAAQRISQGTRTTINGMLLQFDPPAVGEEVYPSRLGPWVGRMCHEEARELLGFEGDRSHVPWVLHSLGTSGRCGTCSRCSAVERFDSSGHMLPQRGTQEWDAYVAGDELAQVQHQFLKRLTCQFRCYPTPDPARFRLVASAVCGLCSEDGKPLWDAVKIERRKGEFSKVSEDPSVHIQGIEASADVTLSLGESVLLLGPRCEQGVPPCGLDGSTYGWLLTLTSVSHSIDLRDRPDALHRK